MTTANASGLFGWWREGSVDGRRALIGASMGWLLDSFDVMLYALVLAALMEDLGMAKTTAGLLGSLTLVASAVGGVLFGFVADRWGRTKALMGSILIYSIFTGACGLSQTVTELAVFRVLLGIGMGGEWASGAALVSETWSTEHRGKALGVMQSSWAIGYAAAAIVTAIVLPRFGWRAVFFVGVLPALATLWVQRKIEEPAIWRQSRAAAAAGTATGGGIGEIFRGGLLPLTVAITLMNGCTMFAWWGFNLWIPAYLSLPVSQGGVGLSAYAMSGLVVAMQVGMWFGYVTYGFISDKVGRKPTYIIYLLAAAVLIVLYATTRNPMALLVLGPFVAFFGTGYFSGFGSVTAEIYPTRIRATAQGLTYNIGRVASAAAPFIVGSLADTRGFGVALSTTAVAFVLAAVMWIWIPETKGRALA
ncbi:MAG TPA: MFS transporter [Vicinamibacterales bacterium]|nr:MFS transporter [Vicinamibacterales bacterium]